MEMGSLPDVNAVTEIIERDLAEPSFALKEGDDLVRDGLVCVVRSTVSGSRELTWRGDRQTVLNAASDGT
jgi:hypothetical protein